MHRRNEVAASGVASAFGPPVILAEKLIEAPQRVQTPTHFVD
jgi:hypothetical protein